MEKSENEDKIEKICQHDKIVNDNICDDEANVYECDFDGGDCCAEESIKDFCLQCQCFCNINSYHLVFSELESTCSYFSVTTIESSTYSTTTTLSSTSMMDICPECPKEGVLIPPMELTVPPVKIRTGKMEDCKQLCYHNTWTCQYFIFFTEKFQGDMKNMCVMFERRREETLKMPGVISGRGFDSYIFYSPGYSYSYVDPAYAGSFYPGFSDYDFEYDYE